jgi:long-chain fatty acid transport protein
MSRYPNDLSGNRKSISTGFGVRIGYYGELLQNFYVGAAFQTKMYMSEFDEYKGLFE